jgi:serine protease Do
MLNNSVYIGVETIDGEHWAGSGVIVGGKLITAGHVVDGADYFKIIFNDGFILEGEFNYYKETEADVGIIDINELSGGIIIDTTFKVGDDIFIMGCPFGRNLQNNLTKGIISKLSIDPSIFGNHQIMNVDAGSYPGNSGGGVFDSDGELIGILVGGIGGTDGISFCIPSTVIKLVIEKYEAIKQLENCP